MTFKKIPSKLASKKSKLSEEKKTPPEHKYSVIFVPKVGTKRTITLKIFGLFEIRERFSYFFQYTFRSIKEHCFIDQ